MEKASKEGFWANNAVQVTKSWIRDGLKERCITRDLKWGIPVPKPGYEDKVFYVWFDAPIGYVSISANATKDWKMWWQDPDNVELFQFIGKDNIPFHTVIFPSCQLASGENWTMLHHMSSTEYLNYEGGKFSKSLGIGIFGNDVQDTGIPADVWRFYMFYNRPEKSDVTFTWADFQEKVNGELIGNLSNLVNRTLTFIKRFYPDNALLSAPIDEQLHAQIRAKEAEIEALMERSEERDGLRQILALSSIGNKAFQDGEPWKMRNQDPQKAMSLLKTLVYLIRDLAVMVEPFMPTTSARMLTFLGCKDERWNVVGSTTGITEFGEPELLFTKLEDVQIEELRTRFSGSQEERKQKEQTNTKEVQNTMEQHVDQVSLAEQFAKRVILKVAKIINVEKHPQGDKLYILTLDVKEEETRTIVSSIVPYYTAEELQDQQIVLVSNLKPANFRGVKSYGMLLAASDPDAEEHTTCEVLFVPQFEVGAVLLPEGHEGPQEALPYVKADHFFSMPIVAEDGVVKIDGKPLGKDGLYVTSKKYLNGPVG